MAFSIHVQTFFCRKVKSLMIRRKVARNFKKRKKRKAEACIITWRQLKVSVVERRASMK